MKQAFNKFKNIVRIWQSSLCGDMGGLQSKFLPTLLALACIAGGWQLVALQIGYPAIFPSLPDLLIETCRLICSSAFFTEVGITVLRAIFGFALAFSVAFLCASVAAFSPFWKAFFHPFIIVSRSIPVISLVLIALLWFAPPQLPVFIALITMFPILYQNTLTGLLQTDKRLLEMATVFGKTTVNQFFHIYLPSGKTIIFDGIKTAVGFGWRAIIIGEVLAQPMHGIGTVMKQAQAYINVSEVIAWTVVAVIISYFFEFIIKFFQRSSFEKKLPKATHFGINVSKQSIEIKSIKTINLIKKFNQVTVLNGVNLTLDSTKINVLKAPSGKGKTTLLRLLANAEKPDSGEITFSAKFKIGYAFQDVRLLPWLTVSENVAYVLSREKKEEIGNWVEFLLRKMELTEHAHKYPHELSGGQLQRVGLARALATQPDILLLDEPLSGLDNELKQRIMSFLSEWMLAQQPLVVWATHEEVQLGNVKVSPLNPPWGT